MQMMYRTHTSVYTLKKGWDKVKKDGFNNRNPIRVLDGDFYSLIYDDEFYERFGCRKLINGILFTWDYIRDRALKNEVQNDSKLTRTKEEQDWLVETSNSLDKDIATLIDRLDLYDEFEFS